MMRRLVVPTLVMLIASALPLSAQAAPKVVAPGMSRAKVVAVLGQPATVRSVAEFTYMFYQNACGKRCGMNDLVVLRGDSVVDAIFRSPSRSYSGTSSSPAAIPPEQAARSSATSSPKMKPPTQANDARPSIPLNRPTLSPSPATPPATKKP